MFYLHTSSFFFFKFVSLVIFSLNNFHSHCSNIFFKFVSLVIFSLNNFHSHCSNISSVLWWCLLARGQYNLSPTWDQTTTIESIPWDVWSKDVPRRHLYDFLGWDCVNSHPTGSESEPEVRTILNEAGYELAPAQNVDIGK